MATKKPSQSGRSASARRDKAASKDQATEAESAADTPPETVTATDDAAVGAAPTPATGGADTGDGGVLPPPAPSVRNPAFIAMGLAIVAVVLALTTPVWGPRVYGDPLSQQITATNEILERVTKAVSEIEATIPGLRTASGDSEARLRAMEARLEEIKLPSFLLALGELRRALRGSDPFETELDVAITVTGGGTDLGENFAKVADLAPYGVPTTRQLDRRFGEIAQRIFLTSQLSDDPTVTSRALARMNAVAVQVRVRFFGERPGNDVTSIISRIQARIDEGNLPKAIQALETLPESSRAVAANWVKDAKKRIRVNELQEYLKTLMMKRAVAGNKP